MAARRFALLHELGNCIRLPLSTLALLVAACLAAVPSAHAQAAVEYGGATSVSAGAVSAKPGVFTPGAGGSVNHSVFLAKPSGTPPEQLNREWFAKQAGKEGAQLTIDATPAQTSVWIDGKFVGKAPLMLTLAAGKHHLSLLGPRQEHAERDVNIVGGKNDRLTIRLQETYPSAVAIRVFGGVQH
jgi:hypothetical protein